MASTSNYPRFTTSLQRSLIGAICQLSKCRITVFVYIRFMITDDYYYKIVFMNCRHHLQLQIRSNKQTHRYTIATNVNRIHKARHSSYSIPIKHSSTGCVKSSRPTLTRYKFNKQFSWFFSLLNSATICGGRCN